jgi:hypothetical protein
MDKRIIEQADEDERRYKQMKRGMRRWFNRYGFIEYLQRENESLWKYDAHTVEMAAQDTLRRCVFGMRMTKELQAYILKENIAGITELFNAIDKRKAYRQMKAAKKAKKEARHEQH